MSQDLLFIVKDVFSIKGRGTVLAGELVRGSVAVGDEVTITGSAGAGREARIAGVERNRELLEHASAGEGPVSLLVEGVSREDVARGSSVRAAGPQPASASAAIAAGWMSDAAGRHEWRYWDGAAWTAHVSDAGVAAEDPLPVAPGADAGIERMRAMVSEQLARRGPGAFAHLKLDIDPALLPERVILLGTELERATRPGQVLGLLDTRASIYEALGMSTEADRDRLAWAAIKEGHSGLSGTSKAWARGIFGLEYGSTFAAAYDLSTKHEGEKVRVPLMRAGRAVALGYCPKCRSVEQLDEHLRCPAGHSKTEDVACVVPGDVPGTRAVLDEAHPR